MFIKLTKASGRTYAQLVESFRDDGGTPVPLKYVITSKRIAGAPEYSVVMSNWNLKPTIAADRFKFVAPKGATNLKGIEVDETGEITITEGAK